MFNKRLVIIGLVCTSLLCEDDIHRLETIVNDITQLRVDYEECKSELQSKYINKQKITSDAISADIFTCQLEVEKINNYARLLEEKKQKNKSLTLEILKISTYNNINSALHKTIQKQEKELKKHKLLLITKDKEINYLENRLNKYAVKPILITKICKEKNVFPKLMIKEDSLQEDSFKIDSFKIESSPVNLDNEDIVTFAASTFRVKVNTTVYDSPNGKKIQEWQINTSFTSTQRMGNWIKITGYFIDKKWLKAKRDIWIKEEDVFKR